MDTPDRMQRTTEETAPNNGTALVPAEPRALAPSVVPPRRVWAEAAGALLTVCGVGAAEVLLLDLPTWIGVPFVAVACAIAVDRIRIARRPWRNDDAPAAPEPPASVMTGRAERLARHLAQAASAAQSAEAAAALAEAAAANGHVNGYATANGDGAAARALPAIGYTYVPARPDGAQLAADTEDIRSWCQEAGVVLTKLVHDVENPSAKCGGPGLQWALAQVAAGEAGTLVVARLRNLSPTVAGMSPLLRWFADPSRRLVAVEEQVDTATDVGRLAAIALASVGSGENERLSERTRRGLEKARSQGRGRAGATVADVPELRERIIRMRNEGMTLQAIADALNDEGVPTLRGGAKWRPSSVHTATGYRRPAPARGIRLPDDKPGA
jgi:DNA invertase Pin-like site-specific DNA recombinase